MDPFAGLAESFTLFLFNFSKTFDSHLSGLSISHTEYIVSLNSSVDTTVAWDWFSQGFDYLIGFSWLNTVESGAGLLSGLWIDDLLSGDNESLSVGLLCIELSLLLLQGGRWSFAAEESMLLRSKNWLLN